VATRKKPPRKRANPTADTPPSLPPMQAKEQAIADLIAGFTAMARDFLALHNSAEVAPDDQEACLSVANTATLIAVTVAELSRTLTEETPPTLADLQQTADASDVAAGKAKSARQVPSPRRLTEAWKTAEAAMERCSAVLDAVV
jgi:hypothetical protein